MNQPPNHGPRCAACGEAVNGRAFRLRENWYCGEHATWVDPKFRSRSAPDAAQYDPSRTIRRQ